MREYFELYEGGFLSSKLAENDQKILMEEGKAILTKEKRDNDCVYYASGKNCVIGDERLASSLCSFTRLALKRIFREWSIAKNDLVMIVGIGNEGLTADSLGAKVVEKIQVTAHLDKIKGYGKLCAYAPGVGGTTGIASFDVVKALVDKVLPKVVICIDTLACSNPERLGSVIQIKDSGLTPGAGVGNAKIPLDKSTLGVPVVGIGVPLIIYARNLLLNYLKGSQSNVEFDKVTRSTGDLVVTAKEIDLYIDVFSRIISNAINKAVHGKI